MNKIIRIELNSQIHNQFSWAFSLQMDEQMERMLYGQLNRQLRWHIDQELMDE